MLGGRDRRSPLTTDHPPLLLRVCATCYGLAEEVGERGARADSSIAPEVVGEVVRVRAWVRGGVRAQATVRAALSYAALEKAGLVLAMVGVRVRSWGWSQG